MATTEAVICVGEQHGYPCREGRQAQSWQAAKDRDEWQQNYSQSAVVNNRGLQTEITPCSLGAVTSQEAPIRAGNEHSETTISFSFFAAITFVCNIKPKIFWQIVEDLRGKGEPINYETVIDKCYTPISAAYSPEDAFEENNSASGVSSNPSLTPAFESLLSSVHTSEMSPVHDYHQLNSATQKSPSTCSDHSNPNNDHNPNHNSKHLLLSLPAIPNDFHFPESKPNDLYNATEDGEDQPDGPTGGNLESNDGLDRWLVSDFSNPVVYISESNSESMGSPVLSQNLSGLEPYVPTNTPGQNVSFHESENDKPSLASLNSSGLVIPGFTPSGSLADGHSSRLNACDSISSALNSADDISSRLKAVDGSLTVSPGLTDIVCDGAEISRDTDERRNSQATESKPAEKPRTLTEAELFQFTFNLLETEHELLEKSRLCHGCRQKPREITFLPCGHFITCVDCAEPMYVCPLCDKSILATVNTFLS